MEISRSIGLIMTLMLQDKDGNPSTTRSVFFYGCLVCIVKLALSGMNLKIIQMPVFSGSDFGMAIAALGGIYSLNKHVEGLQKE